MNTPLRGLPTTHCNAELYGLSENEVTTIHERANRLCAFATQEGLTAPD